MGMYDFVVKHGKVLYATENIWSKWGDALEPGEILHLYHPLGFLEKIDNA